MTRTVLFYLKQMKLERTVATLWKHADTAFWILFGPLHWTGNWTIWRKQCNFNILNLFFFFFHCVVTCKRMLYVSQICTLSRVNIVLEDLKKSLQKGLIRLICFQTTSILPDSQRSFYPRCMHWAPFVPSMCYKRFFCCSNQSEPPWSLAWPWTGGRLLSYIWQSLARLQSTTIVLVL